MFTIYLIDKEIKITTLDDPLEGNLELWAEPSQAFPFWDYFSKFLSTGEGSRMVLKSSNPQWLFRYAASFFTPHEAAGGLVINPQGQLLFIFRKGKWDLPKGHPNPGETTTETALREVEEECGIDQLSIKAPLSCTYHVFPWKNEQWALKKTTWFLMTTPSTRKPTPQVQEDIIRAEWIDHDQLPEIFNNVFGSVRELVTLAIDHKMI
ncbi:MAG: NUDIX domain-containing protein [Bacteroides sp.]|jgi:8-oxo-dGTP pyrophosphatase MutT (NUDIX family)|nr:NUDIX domain-containing protein [Bacteroides sp.]